ncbi:hypothetical protein U728_918 [Clostridium botulinum 202F]|nr:hypothetical protein U728_918 [Clostridium botulinum 202F]KAI3346090.1 hypothetical protein CIT17_10965 [Clostridium botulinum]KON13353.1 hypothetical protein ACP50_04530 [Clostridium botulinum]MBY6987708.1 hypothetical protein [Clostridium botulinum]NFH01643.1 hypothetical protein [Clostridium botulinum]
MVDYKIMREEIRKFKNKNDVIRFAKEHYSKLTRADRAKIFNEVIQDRQIDLKKFRFSLRLSIEISCIFISYKTNFMRIFSKYKFSLEEEKEIFIIIVEKIYELGWSKKLDNNEIEKNDLRRYLSYKYDYPSINIYEYFKLFKCFDKLSEDIYGLSIYRNFYELIILVASKENLYIENNILKKEFGNIKNLENLFLDGYKIKDSLFIEDNLRTVFKGKLGIKFSDGVYIPRAYNILENIFRGIIESEKSKDKKGDILEAYSKDIIGEFFKDIHHTSYDNKGNEQDLIIEFEDKILFVECKSQNFKSIFIEGKDSTQTREKHFKDVIVKACEQCQRGKEYLLNNKIAIYYNSNKKKGRKKILQVNSKNNKKIFKIVVVLDEYLDLAELSNRYLGEKYKDTWVVNIFALNKILWISNRINGISTFFEYLEYRTQKYLGIESIQCDELAQFGYWISPNYNNYPQLGMNINIVLNNSFTNIFHEYDSYFYKELVKKLGVNNK